MRLRFAIVVVLLVPVVPAAAQDPRFQPVATIGELMRDVVYPLSDELFYVMRNPPETDYEWTLLRRSALILAESGNLLMVDGRGIPEEDWRRFSMRLIEVSTAAYEATEARDLDAIVALSPELEQSCRDCHEQYHPRFGRRRPGAEGENP
jgi:hypothetical protein